MQIVNVLKGTLGVSALTFMRYFVVRRSCRRLVRNTLRNKLVTWSTAIVTDLPVLPFHNCDY